MLFLNEFKITKKLNLLKRMVCLKNLKKITLPHLQDTSYTL